MMSEVREWTTTTETAEIAALKARIVELEHERDDARALLDAVREVVAASVAMDETRPDALRFLRAVDAHEAATRGLGEGVRAWAREEARDVG